MVHSVMAVGPILTGRAAAARTRTRCTASRMCLPLKLLGIRMPYLRSIQSLSSCARYRECSTAVPTQGPSLGVEGIQAASPIARAGAIVGRVALIVGLEHTGLAVAVLKRTPLTVLHMLLLVRQCGIQMRLLRNILSRYVSETFRASTMEADQRTIT